MGNINVGYTKLAALGEQVKGYLETVDSLKTACTTAGENAVRAGGSDTRVAAGIRKAIVEPSDTEFEAVKQVIDGFADALQKVSTLYKGYDDNMVEGIEKIAAARQAALAEQAQTTSSAE